jgi:hypothetical protein
VRSTFASKSAGQPRFVSADYSLLVQDAETRMAHFRKKIVDSFMDDFLKFLNNYMQHEQAPKMKKAFVDKLKELLTHDDWTYKAIKESFDNTGKKINGTVGSRAISGNLNGIGKVRVIVVFHAWCISELAHDCYTHKRNVGDISFIFDEKLYQYYHGKKVYRANWIEFDNWFVEKFQLRGGYRVLTYEWQHQRSK